MSMSTYNSPQKQNLRHDMSLPQQNNKDNNKQQEVAQNESKTNINFYQNQLANGYIFQPTRYQSFKNFNSDKHKKHTNPLNDLQQIKLYKESQIFYKNGLNQEQTNLYPQQNFRVRSNPVSKVESSSKQEARENSINKNEHQKTQNADFSIQQLHNVDMSKSAIESLTPKYQYRYLNRKSHVNTPQSPNSSQLQIIQNTSYKNGMKFVKENNPLSFLTLAEKEDTIQKKKKSSMQQKVSNKNPRAILYPLINTSSFIKSEYQNAIRLDKEQISFVQNNTQQQSAYKFIIGNGNNSQLVREILQQKGGWEETQSHNLYFHFNWQPISQGINFERIKSTNIHRYAVNHFEQHKEISSKIKLIKNLENHCRIQQIYLFDITPISYCIDYEQDSYEQEFEDFLSFFMSKSHNPSMDYMSVELLRRKNYYKNSIYPDKQIIGASFKSKQSAYQGYSQPRSHFTMFKGHNIWMIKPAEFNRGRGIRIFTSIQQLNKILSEYQEDNAKEIVRYQNQIQGFSSRYNTFSQDKKRSNSSYSSTKRYGKPKISQRYVIQKYIEAPLLIDERKFDIRMWVLISFDNKSYVFKEGYIRTACVSYDTSEQSLSNNIVHLTNNAIQKYAQNYGQHEQGNQLSFKNFEEYLTKKRINCNFNAKVLPKIKDVMSLTIDSVRSKLNPQERKFCFEIFGYDFIIDNNFNPWLIEVNTNPCIEQSSDMLSILLKRMLDDAFKLTLDQLFNPSVKQEESQYPVEGYSNKENMWEQLISGTYQNLRGCQSSLIKKK
ncbi:hypothetical protein ABPG74_020333 [Tetrahymena malaccensis]